MKSRERTHLIFCYRECYKLTHWKNKITLNWKLTFTWQITTCWHIWSSELFIQVRSRWMTNIIVNMFVWTWWARWKLMTHTHTHIHTIYRCMYIYMKHIYLIYVKYCKGINLLYWIYSSWKNKSSLFKVVHKNWDQYKYAIANFLKNISYSNLEINRVINHRRLTSQTRKWRLGPIASHVQWFGT